jgi:uncharacterized protein YndB with AHSA1/START domain
MAMREQTSAYMDASPEQVFELVIDPWKLPSWNRAITEVVEAPKRLEAGSTWKIRLHALSRSWVSKSQVSELDPAATFHMPTGSGWSNVTLKSPRSR